MAGQPSQDGGHTRASSDAQHGEKTFPAGTDPGSVTQVSGLPADHPTMVGSPVTPEIRINSRTSAAFGIPFPVSNREIFEAEHRS